jgi:hypothetical protein
MKDEKEEGSWSEMMENCDKPKLLPKLAGERESS